MMYSVKFDFENSDILNNTILIKGSIYNFFHTLYTVTSDSVYLRMA